MKPNLKLTAKLFESSFVVFDGSTKSKRMTVAPTIESLMSGHPSPKAKAPASGADRSPLRPAKAPRTSSAQGT